MRLVAIGDPHGKDVWKRIVDKEKSATEFIFLGDYFDSFDIPFNTQMVNFLDICQFKKDNSDTVILLAGNHEIHYLIDEKYSGYQNLYAQQIRAALKSAPLQACHIFDDILFIHAGMTKTWAKDHAINLADIETYTNLLFEMSPESFGFTPCPKKKMSQYSDPSGDEICQSPMWVRPKSLLDDKLKGYRQVVGHTPQKDITIKDGVAFTDCLDFTNQYLVIEDGEFKIEHV